MQNILTGNYSFHLKRRPKRVSVSELILLCTGYWCYVNIYYEAMGLTVESFQCFFSRDDSTEPQRPLDLNYRYTLSSSIMLGA